MPQTSRRAASAGRSRAGAGADLRLLPAGTDRASGLLRRRSRAHAANAARGGQRPLVIHGLWPERLEPRTYPHDCPAPPLDLDAGARAASSRDFMPGMADGLHEHEWREHGGCSGLDDDVYISRALELARARRRARWAPN